MLGNSAVVAQKELRAYLTTWVSYLLLAVFLEINALFFQSFVEHYQDFSLRALRRQDSALVERLNLIDMIHQPLLANMVILLMFMAPLLTMGAIAGERRHKTLELLLATPVRPWQIVWGKYLALLAMLGASLATTLVFPWILGAHTVVADGSSLDSVTVAVGYAGVFLAAAAFAALGLAASALTHSQILAALLGFALIFILWAIGALVGEGEGLGNRLADYLSVLGHLEGFLRGAPRLRDFIYFLSIIFLGLYFTRRAIAPEGR